MELTEEELNSFYDKVLGGISVPDSWESLEDFIRWYVDSGMPLCVDFSSEVIHVEGFSAATLLKKGQYQIELYHIYNFSNIPHHAHPGIEVYTFQMGGGETGSPRRDALKTSTNWMSHGWKAESGELHGGIGLGSSTNGWVIISFQKWPEGVEPEAVSAWWVGATEGPLHEKVIERYFPGAVLYPGFADITTTERFKRLFPTGRAK
jgi:hypothetical protein